MKVFKYVGCFLLILFNINILAMIPERPVLEEISVSYFSDINVRVKWSQQDADNIRGFIIYRWDQIIGYDSVGFVGIPQLRIWDDPNAPSGSERCIYRISTLYGEVFGETFETPMSDERFQSILLNQNIDYDPCKLENTLQWTEYQIDGQVDSYRVWVRTDQSVGVQVLDVPITELTVVDSVSTWGNTSHRTKIYSYTHSGIEPDRVYTYYVEAITDTSPTYTGRSNTVSKNAPAYLQPQPPHITRVTVDEADYVWIFYETTTTDLILSEGINLNRYVEPPAIDSHYILDFPPTENRINDTELNTQTTSYYYNLELIDNCSNPVAESNLHRTILLEGDIDAGFIVSLNWNEYKGWPVMEQKLYRKQAGDSILLVTFSPGVTDYLDDISALPNREARFEYYLVAEGDDPGIQTSRSNTLKIQPDFEPFMPNAFNPNGVNNIFKPIISFYNTDGYLFQIYDRWGAVVWETADPTEGWDGKNANGELFPVGTFVFLLKYTSSAGLESTKQGTVTLVY
ncbi:MAG: hypothetical protein CVT92_12095 [Bacteroidetes bacterium HGW-Bacteroidetes-1]|jgi:gliding motility-associated-like protein|nr:MAG: hypothetical protein CVT92_12095 [Bacteroidetes bacterium HGW-Bacteroidetes-1]